MNLVTRVFYSRVKPRLGPLLAMCIRAWLVQVRTITTLPLRRTRRCLVCAIYLTARANTIYDYTNVVVRISKVKVVSRIRFCLGSFKIVFDQVVGGVSHKIIIIIIWCGYRLWLYIMID